MLRPARAALALLNQPLRYGPQTAGASLFPRSNQGRGIGQPVLGVLVRISLAEYRPHTAGPL